MTPPRALAVAWFVVQGLAVAAWWALLVARPSAGSWFLPPANDASPLLAFSLTDALLLVGGSLTTAILCARDYRWALPLAWLVAGAADYATFHVLGWALLAGGGWTRFIALAPCALISTTFALDLVSAHVPIYRRARAASANTFGQTRLVERTRSIQIWSCRVRWRLESGFSVLRIRRKPRSLRCGARRTTSRRSENNPDRSSTRAHFTMFRTMMRSGYLPSMASRDPTAFNARLSDTVQIGGVYTPPTLRGRGYAQAVDAGSLLSVRDAGVQRAILFTGQHNIAARRAYLALGFEIIGDFGMVLFS